MLELTMFMDAWDSASLPTSSTRVYVRVWRDSIAQGSLEVLAGKESTVEKQKDQSCARYLV